MRSILFLILFYCLACSTTFAQEGKNQLAKCYTREHEDYTEMLLFKKDSTFSITIMRGGYPKVSGTWRRADNYLYLKFTQPGEGTTQRIQPLNYDRYLIRKKDLVPLIEDVKKDKKLVKDAFFKYCKSGI
jgi:hypothetical protein